MKRFWLLAVLPLLWGCSNLAPFANVKATLQESPELEIAEPEAGAAFETPPPPVVAGKSPMSPQNQEPVNVSLPYIPGGSPLSADAISPRGSHQVPTQDRRAEWADGEGIEEDVELVALPAIRPGSARK